MGMFGPSKKQKEFEAGVQKEQVRRAEKELRKVSAERDANARRAKDANLSPEKRKEYERFVREDRAEVADIKRFIDQNK